MWCVVYRCVVLGVVCGMLCVVCGVCGAAWHAQTPSSPRVHAQNVSMCRFKTPPCVPEKRAHVSRFHCLSFSVCLCLSLSVSGVVGGRGVCLVCVCLCVAAR